ncbi:MAG: glucose 1-dehydrogenase [Chloroflexota bacterium]|nr:glucose 1-dehydrogenase [Chloroflexota bacterium]
MNALTVWPKERTSKVIQLEEPALASATAVKFRTVEVGVCGTDTEICSFAYGIPPAGSDYLITGHEALGEVQEVGPDVARVNIGDLVVPSVRRPCPHTHCPACRSGHQDFCVTGDYTERGIKGAHGFLAEYVVEDERYLTPVPAALRDVAVLTEPLTIAEKALRQFVDVQRRLPWKRELGDGELLAGQRAVVLGAGPVGILGCMLLVQRGLPTVVYSRSKKPNPKAELVESIGATYVSSEDESFADLARRIGQVDLVYEAAGASKVAFEVLGCLGANGVFIFTGVPGRKARVDLAADAIMKNIVLNNQAVLGTVNASRADFEEAVRDLERFSAAWPDALRSMITGRHSIGQFCEQAGSKHGIKNVITIEAAS